MGEDTFTNARHQGYNIENTTDRKSNNAHFPHWLSWGGRKKVITGSV